MQNNILFDPFSQTAQLSNDNKIQIHFVKRTARKFITKISGLPSHIDLKDLAKKLSKSLHCRGSVVIDKHSKEKIVQLQGNEPDKIIALLKQEKIISDNSEVILKGC
jgi:translation initiation factor SUI1